MITTPTVPYVFNNASEEQGRKLNELVTALPLELILTEVKDGAYLKIYEVDLEIVIKAEGGTIADFVAQD